MLALNVLFRYMFLMQDLLQICLLLVVRKCQDISQFMQVLNFWRQITFNIKLWRHFEVLITAQRGLNFADN